MSRTIDERVVSMQFDNRNFENNVRTSMSTLERLKQSLKLPESSKSLQNLSSAVKNVDMSSLSKSVETVRQHFSALEVMGVTALANLTNSAVNAGKRIASALTIDPITTGFQEYETQINAVQTILANTQKENTNIDQVNAALDELNKYADQTIYNFTEMTKNIGTFTAAGVKLDDSVSAIKGIANLAAVSGSTSQQASTAMYQLSQALAAGKVSLMDWNSVVNAGMGGQIFQDALVRTSELLKTGAKDAINTYGSFRESLTKGEWLTTEVLTETLNQIAGAYTEAELIQQGYTKTQAAEIAKLADSATDAATKVKTFTQLWDVMKEAAQSGWSQTWRLVIGDFEEAKELFTSLSDKFTKVINASSDSRNNLLSGALNSKWETLSEKITEAGISSEDFQKQLTIVAKSHGISIDGLIKKYGSLGKAFKAGKISGNLIIETLKKFAGTSDKATKSVKDLESVVNKVIRGDFGNGADRVKALTKAGYDYATVQGLVNRVLKGEKVNFDKLSDAQLTNMGYTKEQVKAIRELAKEAEKTGTPINELIMNLEKPSGRELLIDSLKNSLTAIGKVISSVKKAWDSTFDGMSSSQLYNIIEAVNKFTEKLILSDDSANKLTRTFKGLFAIVDIFTTITGGVLRIAIKTICMLLGMADIDILTFTARVGDVIVKIRDWLLVNNIFARAFRKMIEWIAKGLVAMKDFAKEVWNLPAVQKVVTKIADKLKYFYHNVDEYMGKAADKISEFITKLRGMSLEEIVQKIRSISLQDVIDMFGRLRDKMVAFVDSLGIFDKISKVFSKFSKKLGEVNDPIKSIGNIWKAFTDKIKTAADTTGSILGGFLSIIKKVVNFVKDNVGFTDILSVITTAITIKTALTLIGLLKSIAGLANGLTGLVKSISKIGVGISKWANAKAWNEKSQAFKNMAMSIAILAASLYLISKIDSKRLWESVGALGAMAAGLAALAFAMAAVNKVGDPTDGAATMLSMATSMLLLAGALKIMNGLDVSTTTKNIALLLTMMGGLILLGKILGKSKISMSVSILSVLSMAIALKILVGVIEDMNDMNLQNASSSLAILLSIMLGMALISKACQGVSKGAGISLLAMAIALKLVIGSIEDLAEIDAGKLQTGLEGMLKILGIFALVMVASQYAGVNAAKAGIGILAMSVALKIIVSTIDDLAEIDAGTMNNAIKSLAKISLILTAFTVLSRFAGDSLVKVGLMLVLFSASIIIMVGAIALLKNLDPEGMGRAMAVITGLGLMFAVLIKSTSSATNCVPTLITLTVVITLLIGSVALLTMLDQQKLAVASASLVAIMGVFSILVKTLQQVALGRGSFTKALVAMVGMVAIVGLLGLVIAGISKILPGNTMDVVSSLSVMLLSLSAAMIIISKIGVISPGALLGAAGMVAILALLGLVMYELTKLKVDVSLETVLGLSAMLLALSGACVILGIAGASGIAGLVGIGLLVLLIGAIGGLMLAIGALNKHNENMQEFLDVGIVVLGKIGQGLGSFIGNLAGGILGGVAQGLMASLPGIADSLTQFSEKLKPFMSNIKGVDDQSLNSVKNLADILLILTAASLVKKLTDWAVIGKSSFDGIGDLLVPFGKAMMKFTNTIKDISDSDLKSVEIASAAGKLIAEMASTLPNSGGVAGFFAGENDMDDFAKQLVPFGKAICGFADEVNDLTKSDIKSVESAAEAGKAIAEMASTLPNSGGVAGFFAGENDMDDFKDQLVPFAKAIVGFADEVKDISDDDIASMKTATDAGIAIADMANDLPNSGGVVSWFTGDNDLGDFAENVKAFGKAIASFSNEVSGIRVENVQTAADAGLILSKTSTAMAGDTDNSFGNLDSFATGVTSFGKAIAGFSNEVASIDSTNVKTAASAGTAIAEMAAAIPTSGGLFDALSGSTNLEAFGNQLISFGKSIGGFANEISFVDANAIEGATNAGTALIKMGNALPQYNNLSQAFSADNNIAMFGSRLVAFGSYMNKFAASISGINSGAVQDAAVAGQAVAKLGQLLPSTTTFSNSMLNSSGVSTLGSNIVSFGKSMKQFASSVSGVNMTSINTATAAGKNISTMIKSIPSNPNTAKFTSQLPSLGLSIKTFATNISDLDTGNLASKVSSIKTSMNTLGNLGNTGVAKFAKSFTDGVPKVKAGVSSMLRTVVTTMNSYMKTFNTLGSGLMKTFVAGISSYKNKLATAFKTSMDQCVTTLRCYYSSFFTAGFYVAQGFADGIASNSYAATIKATAMASAAKTAAENALGIASPSKVFYKIGSFTGEGFVNALSEYASKSYDASYDMAVQAKTGLSKAISKVSSLIEDGINTQPTIRPVLDLSDVSAGANSIGSLLNTNPSLSLLSDVGTINGLMYQRNQNGSNSEVVSAIKDLKKSIGSSSSNTYNIDGVTYDDGSNITTAVKSIVRAAKIERRI